MLAEAGDPADPPLFLLEAIAAEIVRCCGHRALKANRLAYGWTVERAVTALHTMCRELELGARGLTVRSWLEWEAAEHPNADYQDLLCRLFRTDPVSLGFRRAYGTCAARAAPDLAGGEDPPPETGWVVNRMAQESVAHAVAAEVSDAGPTLLESFGTDVTSLARAYLHDAPGPLFTELVRVRRETCELLARRLRPAQQTEVLLMAGQACGLLANASLDLGSLHAAVTQARSAWTYAVAACHDGLSGWIRGLQAMIAYWSQDYDTAIAFARDGQRFASSPTARTRLHAIEALACATAGARGEALAALQAAERAQHSGYGVDEIHDVIAGEFGFTQAKQSYLAGSTYIRLGRPRQAITSAGTAIRLYEDGPPAERAYGNEALARVDLVNGYLLGGELEAACQSAAGIFELPPGQRIDGLSQRLRGLGGLLRGPRYQRAPQALEFIERIDDFQATQAILPGGTGSLLRRPM
jgi:tetratricopeptide (TPR) repeat protein